MVVVRSAGAAQVVMLMKNKKKHVVRTNLITSSKKMMSKNLQKKAAGTRGAGAEEENFAQRHARSRGRAVVWLTHAEWRVSGRRADERSAAMPWWCFAASVTRLWGTRARGRARGRSRLVENNTP